MTTLFPGALDSYTVKVDDVTDIMAADVNDLQDAAVALETLARQADNNLLYDSLSSQASWMAGTTFSDATDDTYLGSLWNNVNTTNPPDWSQQAGGASDPFEYYLRCTHDADSQAGIVQFIEAKDTIPLRGKTLSLSADLWGTGVTSLRMAVLEWAGTADAVTSDVVTTWAAGNPTLATNWTYIGTPVAITISSTRARKAVNALTVGASTNNLAVFIWTDAVEANTDLWNVARVKLEISAAATDFVAVKFSDQLNSILRFYEQSYPLGTAPGSANNASAYARGATTIAVGSLDGFKVKKRVVPTVSVWAFDGTANDVSAWLSSGHIGATITTRSATLDKITTMAVSTGTPFIAGDFYWFSWVADARL